MSVATLPEKIDWQTAVKSLRSTTCPACGGPKKSRHSLCAKEYFSLPNEMKRALYLGVGDGYEKALLAALKALKAEQIHT